MAEKIKLTASVIQNLTHPPKGRVVYQDTDNKYLNLFISPAGKTFYYVRKVFGRKLNIKIGVFPDIKLAKAKSIHNDYSDEIARGIDPTETKREKRDEMIFAELFNDYLENYAKVQKKIWVNDVSMYRHHLPSLYKLKVGEINGDHIMQIIKKLAAADKRVTANRVVALLSKIFNYAIRQKRLNLINPATGIKKFRENPRKRFLRPDEMSVFFDALNELAKKGNTPAMMRDYFLMLLYAGQRKTVTMAMRWDEIDMVNRLWTIPGDKTKNSDDNYVALCDQAMDILRNRKKSQGKQNSEWVFPCRFNQIGQGHMTEPKKAWDFIRNESGLLDLHMHDLRRSLGSWQAGLGASMKVIGDSLNHKSLDVTNRVYAHLTLDPIRDSVSAAVNAMQQAGKNKPAK